MSKFKIDKETEKLVNARIKQVINTPKDVPKRRGLPPRDPSPPFEIPNNRIVSIPGGMNVLESGAALMYRSERSAEVPRYASAGAVIEVHQRVLLTELFGECVTSDEGQE